MWKALRHPNVLPLIGATIAGTQFAMVSEWMPNGNINEFLKANPDGDRLGLVRVPFRPHCLHSMSINDSMISLA